MNGPETREEKLTDAQGQFEFGGLAAGSYQLRIDAKQGVLTQGDEIPVALSVGEVREMQLDLTSRTPCRISLHVTYNGKPAVGVTARARNSHTGNTNHFGETDDTGALVADLSALGERTLELLSPAGFQLWTFPDVHNFAPGALIELSVDLSPGELELHLPEIPEVELNYPRLELIYKSGYREQASMPFAFKHLRNDTFDWSTRKLHLGPIAPGTYGVHLQLDSERAFIGQAVVSDSALTTCELALE